MLNSMMSCAKRKVSKVVNYHLRFNRFSRSQISTVSLNNSVSFVDRNCTLKRSDRPDKDNNPQHKDKNPI
ncbi:unnamed protein product [Anisakis simplex]|uniref:Uncharacterized protein n=1 Tax=Anisakis simplex TaxID=6269 RepID=A0A3P6RY69_ANISI|nr:unnamed protein product [Anisakis simplex]